MQNNEKTSFIVICGVFVLMVFTYVATANLLPDNIKSEAYYAKIDEEMSAKIENIVLEKGILTITTSGESSKYCVKTTKTTPMVNSLCWNDVKNNKATMSVFEGKKYYVWIKDKYNQISSPRELLASMSERG
jgi:hypothetical protein